jgi:hypothetical protein
MYFHKRQQVLSFEFEDTRPKDHDMKLPDDFVRHHLAGPMVLSVRRTDEVSTSYLQIDSLSRKGHSSAGQAGGQATSKPIVINCKLVSDPLLWNQWVFTIEQDRVDGQERLVACRRRVRFNPT